MARSIEAKESRPKKSQAKKSQPRKRRSSRAGEQEPEAAGKQTGRRSTARKHRAAHVPRVSACLLSWKRPQNLPVIIATLREAGFINEILIWNNNPELRVEVDDPITRVIDSEENAMCYGRFLCAAEARNRVIYVQDDDAVNHDVVGLYREFLANPGRITHALSPSHYQRGRREIYGAAHNALLGWGAFFRREWISVFNNLPASIFQNPLVLREADKLFSILLDREHHTVRGEISLLDGHSNPDHSLWLDPLNRQHKGLAVRQALSLLRLRNAPESPAPWNVVISCYNYGCFLAEAIESVLASDADYGIHIVDDASEDETPEIAADYTSRYEHIRYFRNAVRRGPAYSQNRGIRACRSPFIVLLDADDQIGPDYLFEAQRKFEQGADVVNPDATLFGAREGCWVVPDVTTLEMLLKRNSVHNCAAFRRELWQRAGGIDEHMPRWMDHEFWIRVAAQNAIIEPLHGGHFFYRQHEQSLSRSAAPRVWRSPMNWVSEEAD